LGFSDETLKKIGNRLSQEVNASDKAKSALPDRWKANWGIYWVDSSEASPEIIKGMGGYNIPVTRSKVDRIASNLYGTISGFDPVCRAQDLSDQGVNYETLEQDMMMLLSDGGFFDRLKPSVLGAIVTNAHFLSITPNVDDNGLVCGIKCDDVPAELAFVYPSTVCDLEKTKSYGYHFQLYKFQVQDMIDRGEWRNIPIVQGTAVRTDSDLISLRNDNLSVPSTPVEDMDAPVSLVWGVTRVFEEGGEGKRYCFVLQLTTGELFYLEPWAAHDSTGSFEFYKKPCMVPFRFKTAEKKLWTNDSIMQGMQDLQRLYSRQFTLCQQGSEMAAFGCVVFTGGSIPDQYKQVTPGMVIDGLPAQVKVTPVAFQFNPAVQPLLMAKIEDMIDSLTGYGRLGTGEALPSGATAHEVQALVATMNEQKDEYVDAITISVETIWTIAFEYLRVHYSSIASAYGQALKTPQDVVESAKIRWKLAGSSEGATTGQMLQKLMMALQIAEQDQNSYNISKLRDEILQLLIPTSVSAIKYTKEQIAQQLMMQHDAMMQQQMMGQQPNGQAQDSSTPQLPGMGMGVIGGPEATTPGSM
jgi:hypothetical protein